MFFDFYLMVLMKQNSDDDFDGVSTYTGGDNNEEEEDEATHHVCNSRVFQKLIFSFFRMNKEDLSYYREDH